MIKRNVTVIGAGSFGTALAITLVNKGHNVTLWARRNEQIIEMLETSQNSRYLKDVILPKGIMYSNNLASAVSTGEIVVFAVPTQQFRPVFLEASKHINRNTVIVNLAKGLEKGTHLRLSQIAYSIREDIRYVALSGPSHAEELAMNLPTTVVTASSDMEAAKIVQEAFMTERFRIYTNEDIIGVELGGALKNIIALGAGISDGLGFGDNAKAAMMTRGITEMSRLGLNLGARLNTFSGLTGIGDLIVTCTSNHSRNRRCGILIGKGLPVEDAIGQVGMVVEGISTAEAAYEIAKERDVDMPITQCIYELIKGKITAEDAVGRLMMREKKNEMKII